MSKENVEECPGGCKNDDRKLVETNITEKSVKFTYKCEKCGKIYKEKTNN